VIPRLVALGAGKKGACVSSSTPRLPRRQSRVARRRLRRLKTLPRSTA
jgi:hypothetical protein